MRKIYLLFALMLFAASSMMAQLTGTKTIPGDYANVAAAVTDLNLLGVGAGGVTFNVAAGHTETSDIPEVTATGTVANPVIFQKSGAGANPLLTRLTAGTVASTTSLGSNGDGIIIINGGDYITFNGIDLQTDAGFTAAGMMEYGYYLKKASGTDACKNVTIKNAVITLNKAAIYSFGIFVSNISGTTSVTVTSTGGRSENINLSGNSITNTYGGIQLRGYASSTPFDFYDQNIEVGVDSGNIITNYGGGTTTTYGIYCIYQNNLVIANNNINNTANGGTASANTFYGMFLSTGTNSNVEIHHNTISITAGGTTQTAYALNNAMGASGTNNLVSIHDNIITSCSYPGATSGVLYLLYQNTSPYTSHIYNNTVTGNSLTGTSGSLYCLYQSGTVVNEGKIYGNTITGNTKTTTGTMYCLYNSPSATSTNDVYSNTISGNSGSGTLNGIYHNGGLVTNIFRNQVFNQSSSGATGIVYGMTVAAGPLTTNIFNNFISDLKSPAGDAAADGVRGINITSTTANSSINVDFNTIYLDATSTGVNFSASGVYHTYSATATSGSLTMRNNIIVNVSTPNGAGIVSAFRRSAATSLDNFNTATNNNDYYAGTPAANRLIFYDGTNSDQTLAAYQARVTPRDANSITELPPFTNVSTTPYDLHISGSSGVSNAGIPIAGITTDIDNDPRNATTPDIGADEFASASGIDLRATNLVNPPVKNCYTGTETVTIRIQNSSSVTHDFAVNPVTVTTNVTGAVTQTLSAVVNSGTLGGGLTLDVPMSTTLNMTPTGVYTFNAFTTVTGDINPGNDAMPPVNLTKAVLAAGTVTANPTQYCLTGGTPTLSVAGATGGNLQWQQSTTPGSGFTDIPGATTTPYTIASPITQTMYYRLQVSCDGNTLTSNEDTVILINPQITGTTPGASCGPGPVTVTLAATGNSAVLNWYDVPTGGMPIGTGSPFTTPPISVNTDYWVSASDGGTSGNVGPVNNAIGAGASSTILIGTQQLFFDILAPSATINTVTIYPTAAIGSSFTIVIQNASAVQVYTSGPMTTTVTGGSTPQVVTLNALLPAGTGYRFGFSTNPGMWRNSLGAVYPYTLPGVVSITGNSFDPDYYYWFYNWSVSSGCEGPRTMVTATVTTPPSATISYAGSPYCSDAGTATVTQTGTTGGTYSSTAGLSINAATGEVNLGTSTAGTYTVTYTIAAAGGCPVFTTTASITITAAPSATISYAGSPYCSDAGTATVTQTGTGGGTYSSTAGLTINAATGDVTLGTSTPGTYTVNYTIAASGGCGLFTTTASITITAAPVATIAYTGSPYCTTGGTATVSQTGTPGGTYSSTAGLTINAATGDVTLGTSSPGTYTVTYTIAAAGGCAIFTTTTNITVNTCASSADLAITKTDGVTVYTPGGSTTYTIVASNAGPNPVTGATVTDNFPAAITSVAWSAVYAGGATGPANGAGNISATVNLPVGGTATFTAVCNISGAASGNLVNTATVDVPVGDVDPNPGNNSATDTDTQAVLCSPLTVNAPTITQPDCATATGTIVINASGSGTLEYSIDGVSYQPSATFSSLAQGAYYISARYVASPNCAMAYSGNPVVISSVSSRVQKVLAGTSPFQDSLWTVKYPALSPVLTHIGPTLAGFTITGMNGMATDPLTGENYILMKLTGQSGRSLGRVNIQTGVCTLVGNLGDNFSSITFRYDGQMFGTTGDGATVPETMWLIDKNTAAKVIATALGAGADGEVICYNPDDNFIYHWSGNGTVVFEKIESAPPYATTTIPIIGSTNGETFGAWYKGGGEFVTSNISSSFNIFTTGGVVTGPFGSNPDDLRGLISNTCVTYLTPACPAPICSGDNVLLTANGGTGNYQWYRDGVAIGGANSSTYSAGIAGVYNCIFTDGCAVTDSVSTGINVIVNPGPSATIAYAGSPYCSNAGTATVTRTGTAGGTYSAAPAGLTLNAANGDVTIGTSTPGTYTVTYTIAASGGCPVFTTITTITITTLPTATIAYTGSPYCQGSGTATVTRTGTAGGTYSAVPAGLTLNAATGDVTLGTSTVGTYTVTYTIAAAGGCPTVTATASITVIAAPSATISYAGSPYCSTVLSAPVTRTGTAGGTYSSSAGLTINASTGTVTPNTSTPGTYTVTYTIAASGGCPAFSTTTSITITQAPNMGINYLGSPYCSNAGTANVTQVGTPGGTYSAAPAGLTINAATGAVTLGTSTPGTYTVTYTIPAGGGCGITFTTTTITITAAPAATISYAANPYCSNGGTATVTRTGTAGGTYSSTAGLTINATTGAVTLGTSTPGTYTVTYTIASSGGCATFTTTTTITITALPAATISYTGSPYCSSGGTATVTRTGTAGGTYSAAPAGLTINASTGTVTLGTSTPGTYIVTYTIAAGGGCPVVTATTSITVTALPAATISYAGSPYCQNAGTATVTRTGTAGGTYSSTAGLIINATTGDVTLGTSTPGTYTVTYTLAAGGGCPVVTATTSITVSSLSVNPTGATASSTSLCGPTAITLSVTGGSLGSGATWRWYTGSCGGTLAGTGATLNITPTTTTTYYVRAEGSCNTTTCASVTVTVNVQPTITLAATLPTSLMPGQTSTLTATVNPANPANTTTWYRNGNVVPGATGSSLVVGVDALGLYTVRTTTTAGCTALSNAVLIKDSATTPGVVWIYPNPNSGQFQVRVYTNAQQLGFVRHVIMYNQAGQKVFDETYPVSGSYSNMNVDARRLPSGTYVIQVTDAFRNELLATGRVVIVR